MRLNKIKIIIFILISTISLNAVNVNLSKIKIDYINFENISLENLFGFLSKEYKVNFNIQPEYQDLTISIHIQNTNLKEVLNTIAFQNELVYKQSQNSIYIMPYKKNVQQKYLDGDFYKERVVLKYASISDAVNFLKDMMPGQTVVRSSTSNKPYSNLFDANPDLTIPTLNLDDDEDDDLKIFPEIESDTNDSIIDIRKNNSSSSNRDLVPPNTLYIIPFYNDNRIYLLSTSKKLIKEAKELISDIDLPLKQVLIQGQIYEVTLKDGYSSTFDFALSSSSLPSNSANSSVGFGNISYSFLDSNLLASIDIAKTDGRATFVASPMLLTMNRVKANLDLTENVSILTDVEIGSTTTSEGVTIVQQPSPVYETKSIGTQLEITPYINSEDEILLKIDLSISSISGNTQTLIIPLSDGSTEDYTVDSISTSSLQTVLSAANRKSIVLGGIIRETISNENKKTPILGDIPLLGIPFNNTEKSTEKRELIVILTPTIIDFKNPLKDKTKREVKDRVNEIRAVEKEFYKNSSNRNLDKKLLLEHNLNELDIAIKEEFNVTKKLEYSATETEYDKEIEEFLNE